MITALVLLIIAIPLLGAAYQALGAWRDRRSLAAPGRMVEACGRAFHLHEMGAGAPAVIFESGIAASSLNWRRVQSAVSLFTRAVAYDRSGFGWSDAGREPRLASTIAAELEAVLAAADIPPPYVLCGHSFGGLVVRLFAARHPDQVAALLLVDPLDPSEWWPLSDARHRMLAHGASLARRGALLARLGVVRFALMLLVRGARWLPRLVARASAREAGASELVHLVGQVRKMPEEVWPAVRAHWCLPKCFLTMAGYFEMLPQSVREMEQCPAPAGVPVTLILTAASSRHTPVDPTLRPARLRRLVAQESGHWVHLDQPELVIDALREAVEAARRSG